MIKFKTGDLTKLSKLSGISIQRICDYLSGRLTPSFAKAVELSRYSKESLDLETCVMDWVYPEISKVYIIREYNRTHGRKR